MKVLLLIIGASSCLISLAAGQCYVTCQPGWGNNPARDPTTTIEPTSETRSPQAAGCGVNIYMNVGESAAISSNVRQQNARQLEFPWMAFVVYEYGTYITLRSAAIINAQWLATVANDPVIPVERLTQITVYFAHYRVLGNVTDNDGQFYMRVPITNYFADPKNALAMLRLPTPLGFSNWNVQSLCMPISASTCASQCVPGSRAMQSGWSIFFPDLTNILQKATIEIPANGFLNTSFQLGSVISTVQFGRYTLCGFTGFDNTFLSVCDSIDWLTARQRQVQAIPPPNRPTGMPKCGINGYATDSAHAPMSMGLNLQARATGQIQPTLVNEFPWQVALSVYCTSHPDGSLCATCSGVVINNGWILTTRTCFSGTTGFDVTRTLLADILGDVTKVVIRFGAQEMPRISGINRTQPVLARNEFNMTVPASAIFYDPTKTFAMIKLPTSVTFANWTVQPICVPLESDCAKTCQAGTEVVLSGWSYAGGPLRKVTFTIPGTSGTIDSGWATVFSYGSPVAVQTFQYGQMVPQQVRGLGSQGYYPGQWSAVTLCGLVDGNTGHYVSTCGNYCWMANPEATNVPQYC